MNYKTLRDDFLDLLNRDDCDDSRADRFISLGLGRVERNLRTPMQEITATLPIEDQSVIIPQDYLTLKALTHAGKPLNRITEEQANNGYRGFLTKGNKFKLYGLVSDIPEVSITYYQTFEDEVSDQGVSNFTAIIPDVTMYAALIYASDFFMDSRKGSFESTYGTLVTEVQMQAYEDEMSGGMSITPYGEDA